MRQFFCGVVGAICAGLFIWFMENLPFHGTLPLWVNVAASIGIEACAVGVGISVLAALYFTDHAAAPKEDTE